MKSICPNCEAEKPIKSVKQKETMDVRSCKISVYVEYFQCQECMEEFESTEGHDALEVAYVQYRKTYGMLQPEEIRSWRKGYGLTQKEVSSLLGWGEATLSRYENGALQESAHDKLLRLSMDPHNLLKLIQEAPDVLNEAKRTRLITDLTATESEACSIPRLYEDLFANYQADENSGYRKFDYTKFTNSVLFLCQGGQLKTKLNKLLYYVDFKYFKKFTVSLTGARYAHLPFGPVPENYDFYFADLRRRGELSIDEVLVYQYVGENYTSSIDPDLTVFEESEIAILNEVKEYFSNFNVSQIKDFSHEETGYKETAPGDFISYKSSKDLQM